MDTKQIFIHRKLKDTEDEFFRLYLCHGPDIKRYTEILL